MALAQAASTVHAAICGNEAIIFAREFQLQHALHKRQCRQACRTMLQNRVIDHTFCIIFGVVSENCVGKFVTSVRPIVQPRSHGYPIYTLPRFETVTCYDPT
jgi:hypothetical protein